MLVDTPGLCDDLPEVGNDERYLEMIRSGTDEVDSFWYVICLDETRLTGDQRRSIKLVSGAFGPAIWDRCVIVFTFVDNVKAANYAEVLSERTSLVREEIAKYAPTRRTALPSSLDRASTTSVQRFSSSARARIATSLPKSNVTGA